MKKFTLPVIVSRGLVLLPTNMLRLEFEKSGVANNIIELAETIHDNYLLFSLNDNDIGVVAKIEKKITLPNGHIRVDIKGIRRVRILDYINDKGVPYEGIVCELGKQELDKDTEVKAINKITSELITLAKNIPYISNSFVATISNVKNLSDLVDNALVHIVNDYKAMIIFLNTIDILKRSELLLNLIYNEKESFKIENKINSKVKEEIDNTQKNFIIKEKIKLMKEELGEHSKDNKIDIYKNKIEKLKCPLKVKTKLLHELNRFENASNFSPEISILEEYINTVIALPFKKVTKESNDLKLAKKILDESHFGLEKVKERIIEYLAVKKNTKNTKTPIICLVGPPGVGKTSLASSIAKSINRKFVKISVGGLTDETELIGHRKTYVGSMPGRIITSLIKAECCNPVMLIDEVDKMGTHINNNPAHTLLNVLDYEQNKHFSDNYIEEEFDLSNIMFILTANYLEDIPEPLLDRLEIINLSSYTEYEKIDITKNHLLPKISKDSGFELKKLKYEDENLSFIINHYTKEAGVRELERQISKIIRKIVTQMVVNNIKINKIILSNEVIEKYLGKPIFKTKKIIETEEVGIVNGLAYTPSGGSVLPIEVSKCKGEGNLTLTGNLGDVMKESASIAMSFIKSNYEKFNIDYEEFKNNIHIHVPEGAVKKDGPSAGTALTLVLISLLSNKKIPQDIALTGEITLRGQVLPIGGLKEKTIGALKGNVKKVFIPVENERDLDELPKEVIDNLEFILVDNFFDIYKNLFKKTKDRQSN